MSVARDLRLSYTLEPGWQAPFVEALLRGIAKARRCGGCHRVSFPPQRVCLCGSDDGDWIVLDGAAAIAVQTAGTDGHFALVRFDGADTHAVARLDGIAEGEVRGRLTPPAHGLPEIVVAPLQKGQTE